MALISSASNVELRRGGPVDFPPPDLPVLRNAGEVTQVVVRFADNGDGTSHVRLSAHEWQAGESWTEGWDYFDMAWDIVLQALKAHCEGT
jgi:hypothetical protein